MLIVNICNSVITRAVPDFGFGSGRNPAVFLNPTPANISPELDLENCT